MAARVLIVSPDTGFGGLIQQSLEKSGRYEPVLVPTGRQALELAKQVDVDLAILDADTADLKISELGPALRAWKPEVRILLIPAEEPVSVENTGDMQVNGFLTKPFYLPDLVDIVETALAESPGTLHEADLVTIRGAVEDLSAEPHTGKGVSPAAPIDVSADSLWHGNNNLAVQHLARLSLSTSSQAALLLRQNRLWAYAGQLSQETALELAQIVGQSWKPGLKGGGSADRDVDLARFVHLHSTGKEHLLYATSLENDVQLVLAFDARTPFSEIRNQANSLAAALASPSADGYLEPQMVVESFSARSPRDEMTADPLGEIEPEQTGELDWSLEFDPWQGELPEDDAVGYNLETQGTAASPLSVQDTGERAGAALPEVAQVASLPASAQDFTWEVEHDQDSTQPVRVTQSQTAASPAGSAVHYDLHIAFILVPRLPEHYLIGDLATNLSLWMRRLSLAFGWRLEYLALRPGWLQWIASVEPDTSAASVVQFIRRSTSDLIFAEFPRYAAENPSEDFWAPGYLAVTSMTPLPGEVVKDFVERTRLRQGISGEN